MKGGGRPKGGGHCVHCLAGGGFLPKTHQFMDILANQNTLKLAYGGVEFQKKSPGGSPRTPT